MNDRIHIAAASDLRYLPGAIGMLASLRMALEPEVAMEVSFLHDGLADEQLERTRRAISRIRGKTEIRFHRIEAKFAGFPDFYFPSKMVYARLLIPELVEAERVLYIDSDILVLKSPLHLISESKLATGFGAALESSRPTLADDPPKPDSQIRFDPAQPAFNSGFLLMDLPTIRESGLFREATGLLATESASCQFWDQSALNYAANGRFDLLPQDWNRQNHRQCLDPVESMEFISSQKINVHFVTKAKPWLSWSPFPAEALFSMLLDAIDPARDAVSEEKLRRRVAWKYATAGPLSAFFKIRARFKKKPISDLRTSVFWGQVDTDLKRLRQRSAEWKKLRDDWSRRIAEAMA